MLLKYESFPKVVHEPCAGDGAMVKVLVDAGYTVIASDVRPRTSRIEIKDALKIGPVECIVTNPPYNALKTLVPHWLATCNKLALLVRLNFLEGKSRIPWMKHVKHVIVVAGRMKVNGKSGQFPHCWVVWEKGYTGKITLTIDTI